MDVLAADPKWVGALLSNLSSAPLRAELISVAHVSFVLSANAQRAGVQVTQSEALVSLAKALVGHGSYAGSVASLLPLFDLGEDGLPPFRAKPSTLLVLAEEPNYGRDFGWTMFELTKSSAMVGLHRRGISAALGLSMAELGTTQHAEIMGTTARP